MVVLALAVAVAVAGCGRHKVATAGEAKLENEDLVAVSAALAAAVPQVEAEVAAAKAAWPEILDGVGRHPGAATRSRVQVAAGLAAQLRLPALFTEEGSGELTGPASPLTGQFRSFQALDSRSWQMLDSSLEEIEHGSGPEARFARANLPLYVESVYDAHFTLGGIGKHLEDAYKTLGGQKTFGASLSEARIEQLAGEYSKERNDLSPKERVKLGS
jgi:hypothetical protein